MTSSAPRRTRPDADPWWGEPQPTFVDELEPTPAVVRRPRRARRRTGIGWRLLGLLAVPPRALAGVVARSPRLRRLGLRLLIVAVVLTFLACSVGVILINNVVIGRTAELGELDDRRRELRRDNALLGAEAAKLGQPTVVWRKAERDLGMVHPADLPQFIYLEPGSHPLTPLQRERVRAARQRVLERGAAAGARPPRALSTKPASIDTTQEPAE